MRSFSKIVVVLLFLPLFSWGTHNRAGEITYKYRSDLVSAATPYPYEVTITTYTKGASSSADRCELVIYFGDGDSLEVKRSNGLWGGSGNTDPWGASCNNAYVGEQVGNSDIKKNVYGPVIHYYDGPGTYILSMFDKNRNSGVANIPNSVDVPFYIESHLMINNWLGGKPNSSPVLTYPPIDNACVGSCFFHNPVAFDPDGDSLAYVLTNCKGTDGLDIFGYTLPPTTGQFYLDPLKGDLIWCDPPQQGEYNVAFWILEYRRGALIGKVLRDMQIDVTACNNDPPVITGVNDTCLIAGNTLTFQVTATDPNPANVITLSAYGGLLSPFLVSPAASFPTVIGSNAVSSTFSWVTDCKLIRKQPYTVTFKASDDGVSSNGSPLPLVDLKTISIKIVGPPVTGLVATSGGSSVQLDWDPALCSNVVGYRIYRKNSCGTFVYDPCNPGVPASSGYTEIGMNIGVNNVTFTDNNNGQGLINGVDYSYIVAALFVDGSLGIASTEVCVHLKRDVPLITNVDVIATSATSGQIEIKWIHPSIGINDLDTTLPANKGPYQYKLMRATGFNPLTSSFVEIQSFTGADFASLSTSFIDNNLNTANNPYTYRVDFYTNGGALFKGSTQFASSVFLSIAASDNTLELTWEEHVPWNNYGYVIYQETSAGSGVFNLIDSVANSSYTVGGLVNGASYCFKIKSVGEYSDTNIVHPLINFSEIKCEQPVDKTDPCSPALSLLFDCTNEKNTLTWTNPNLTCTDDVVSYNIYFKPNKLDTFNLIATNIGPTNTSYIHTYVTPEGFNSIVGCYAITAVDTFLNESLFSNVICIDTCQVYELPNVFSPEGDGVNDFYNALPYKYIQSVEMQIYDRWGVLIFETTDPSIRWDGKNKDTKLDCSEGVYFYVCKAYPYTAYDRKPFLLKGFIHLMRNKNPGKAN